MSTDPNHEYENAFTWSDRETAALMIRVPAIADALTAVDRPRTWTSRVYRLHSVIFNRWFHVVQLECDDLELRIEAGDGTYLVRADYPAGVPEHRRQMLANRLPWIQISEKKDDCTIGREIERRCVRRALPIVRGLKQQQAAERHTH